MTLFCAEIISRCYTTPFSILRTFFPCFRIFVFYINVIKLRIYVLRTFPPYFRLFSPYFRILFYGHFIHILSFFSVFLYFYGHLIRCLNSFCKHLTNFLTFPFVFNIFSKQCAFVSLKCCPYVSR